MRPLKKSRVWPLVPFGPLIVVLVGLAAAIAIGVVGSRHLEQTTHVYARDQAELLAGTLAARLGKLTPSNYLDTLQLASQKTGAEYLLVSKRGDVVHDLSLGAPKRDALLKMLSDGAGDAIRPEGRTRFSVRPIGDLPEALSVIVLVRMPERAEHGSLLASALIALATLLIGVAATVAFAVSRDATRDVDYLAWRVREMARVRAEPAGEPIPVRSIDEVGTLSLAFNDLVGRFSAAERIYREDLARASKADSDRAAFLAAVSHELRSPLNAILGFADVLAEEVDGPLSPSAKEEVDQIRDSGAHLLELINDILEFSALEGGQLKLSKKAVDLAQIASEVVRELTITVGEKPVAVRVSADEPVVTEADPKRVRQILTNLVSNAIKFTERGEVVVTVGIDRHVAFVRVLDTGPGIPHNERLRIFEEYKQTQGERERKRGTGLGLAIANRLVQLHDGHIGLESDVGKGSTFTISLPLTLPKEAR